MIIKRIFCITILFYVISCNDNDLSLEEREESIMIRDIVNNLGGVDNILNVDYIKYSVKGSTYEWEQPITSEPNPLNGSNYNAEVITSLKQRQLRAKFEYIQYNHPFDYRVENGLLIINDKKGTISGGYDWSSFYYNNIAARPMYSSMIESLLKNHRMANPIRLLQEYFSDNYVQIKNNKILFPSGVEGLYIELILNKSTLLPQSARVMEADNLKGDVPFEIIFSNWVQIEGIKYPETLTYSLNGEIIKTETLSHIQINPEIKSSSFLPLPVGTELSYNEENAKLGVLFSQWYHRWTAWGIRMDDPLNNGAIILDQFDLSIFDLGSQEIGRNVKLIGRPDNRTWATVINTPKGIIFVDAPVNHFWMNSLIEAAQRAFPNKPILSVIISHTHHVFLGGIREVASLCDQVYVGQKGVKHVINAFNSKHLLSPDNLTLNSIYPKVIGVEEIIKVQNIEIHPLINNYQSSSYSGTHSDDMLIVYVPENKVIIQSDMIWTGEFLNIWYGKSTKGYTSNTISELQKRARYLLDYIDEKQLDVDKIISSHGGVCSIEDLKNVANKIHWE